MVEKNDLIRDIVWKTQLYFQGDDFSHFLVRQE